jgi:hypothetical protein
MSFAAGVDRLFYGFVGGLGGIGTMYLAQTVKPGEFFYPYRGLLFWLAIAAGVGGIGFMLWGFAVLIINFVRKRWGKRKGAPPPQGPPPSGPSFDTQGNVGSQGQSGGTTIQHNYPSAGPSAVRISVGPGARMSNGIIRNVRAIGMGALNIDNQGEMDNVNAYDLYAQSAQPTDNTSPQTPRLNRAQRRAKKFKPEQQ